MVEVCAGRDVPRGTSPKIPKCEYACWVAIRLMFHVEHHVSVDNAALMEFLCIAGL